MIDRINLSVPLNSTSYGLTGFKIWEHLDKLGIDICLFPIGGVNPNVYPPHLQDLFKRSFYQMRRPSLFPDAPSLKLWHQHGIQEAPVTRGPKVAFTIFELDRLTPLEQDLCAAHDLVITSNSYHKNVLEKHGCKSAYVPLGVDRSIFHEDVPSIPLHILNSMRVAHQPKSHIIDENTTIFIHTAKAEYRKGLDACKIALERAFNPGDNFIFLLITHNPFLIEYDHDGNVREDGNMDWVEYYRDSPLRDHFVFLDRFRTQNELASFMRSADCMLSPSRAEGYNLPVCEMISTGGWVILTDCTAHSDFICQATSAFELDGLPLYIDMGGDHNGEPAVDGTKFFRGQGNWYKIGETQINQMVENIRTIHQIKQGSGSLPQNTDGIELSKIHSWENCATNILSAIGELS